MARIIIFKGEDPKDIAIRFIKDNSFIYLDLNDNLVDKLTEMITLKLAKLATKIDEVDESEENSDF